MADDAMAFPRNVVDLQCLVGFWNERADILESLKTYHAAGDSFHVDLALDALVDWERRHAEMVAERAAK